MDVTINPRGNGACPFCRRLENCRITATLKKSVEGFKDPENHGMEVAIYRCPMFDEKNRDIA